MRWGEFGLRLGSGGLNYEEGVVLLKGLVPVCITDWALEILYLGGIIVHHMKTRAAGSSGRFVRLRVIEIITEVVEIITDPI